MASSSSSLRNWRFRVFTSFHGPDVRKTFLSHLRRQFSYNGISMFDDQGIERSQVIAPALKQAIRESRISIVVLSKNYASSSWCLDELVEILKCRQDIGQIVMTIFYGVDPSDVRKQTGDFGKVFKKTCAGKTKEERRRWSQALNDVGNIAGEHFLNWDNEAEMIEKIAKDVLDKLNAKMSWDFDGVVGLEAHLRKMESLLDFDYDGVKVVAITGPAGIGKTTIARALQSLLSDRFQLACSVDNLRGSYHSGFDEHGLKLRLQEQFLSKVLNHSGMRICHLGAIKENLCDQKVLIILDDVNNLNQLEALANETTWFGPGSRIVVTTENQELLQQHGIGIDDTYDVGFPSSEEAVQILCSYAFKQSSPLYGFKMFFGRIAELCGHLPLALRVVGSSLRGKKEDEWEDVVNRLETVIDRDIENVLRVGYESLDEKEQMLFLHIAVFFNYEDGDLVKAMFADNNLDVKRGLKILVYRSLITISAYGNRIGMHTLLRQMARQAIRKQEPWKRQILMDAHEICDVLENETGAPAVSGISFDISGINEVTISGRAFKRMPNLQFLSVYKSRDDGNDQMYIPEDMEFPRRLRLLHWDAYPSKFLPPTFRSENLVELCMRDSQLEYLWQGTQLLPNLKKMDLFGSYHLKELPDLSNATNLEELQMTDCQSLVEIPSSFSKLQKLKRLQMKDCVNLQVCPPQLNLVSLEVIDMTACSKLKCFSFISANFRDVDISETSFDVPPSVRLYSRLKNLTIWKSTKLEGLTYLPTSVKNLDLSYSDIERIPDSIKALPRLRRLSLTGCRRLASLPELPASIKSLMAEDCGSLETIFCPLNQDPDAALHFINCFKLDEMAQKEIIKRSLLCRETILPGREVPAEFDHRARGNTLTIHFNGNNILPALTRLKTCVVLSPNHQIISKYSGKAQHLLCRRLDKGDLDPFQKVCHLGTVSKYGAEHLVIFQPFPYFSEIGKEMVLEFNCTYNSFNIIECGACIWTDETSSISRKLHLWRKSLEDRIKEHERTNGIISESKEEESVEGKEEHTDCWSWLFLCFGLSHVVRNVGNLVSGRR